MLIIEELDEDGSFKKDDLVFARQTSVLLSDWQSNVASETVSIERSMIKLGF